MFYMDKFNDDRNKSANNNFDDQSSMVIINIEDAAINKNSDLKDVISDKPKNEPQDYELKSSIPFHMTDADNQCWNLLFNQFNLTRI